MKDNNNDSLVNDDYVSSLASNSLRVVCYGSSSSKTPEKYLAEARALGYILACRGHVCVNGAGSFGCMAAMNAGAASGNGHIVGVIHEMWVVDGSDWSSKHVVDAGAHDVFQDPGHREGPIRELLVAGGDDLQERKKLLVKDANALIVLPGGPGTWDELWEMACAKQIGLSSLPIVCVNVDRYYESFREMLDRAYEDELIKLKPHEILHFEPTAEAAVKWIEEQAAQDNQAAAPPKLRKRESILGRSASFMAPPVGNWGFKKRTRWENGKLILEDSSWTRWALTFAAGLAIGVLAATHRNKS